MQDAEDASRGGGPMAGAMRRMGIYLGLVEDDDPRGYGRYDSRQSDHADYDRDYPDGYGDDLEAEVPPAAREPEPLPVRRDRAARPIGLAPAGASAGAAAGGSRISAMGSGPVGATAAKLAVREPIAAVVEPTPAPAPAPQPYRITTLHPRTYNEARTIGERFRDGMPVIMNLTEMDDADAKRLVDFAAGLSFGLRGSIERVTAKVFLLSPQNVDVTAEDKARIREGGFFNQS